MEAGLGLRRGQWRLAVALLAGSVAVAGCGAPATTAEQTTPLGSTPADRPDPDTTADGTAGRAGQGTGAGQGGVGGRAQRADGAGDPLPAPNDRSTAIYRAVLRHLVREVPRERLRSTPRIYLVDAPMTDVFGPRPRRGARFEKAARQALRDTFQGLPPVRLIHSPDEDLLPTGVGVENGEGSSIIMFGPVSARGSRAEVDSLTWCGTGCRAGATWIVQRDRNGWRVTGRAGPGFIT